MKCMRNKQVPGTKWVKLKHIALRTDWFVAEEEINKGQKFKHGILEHTAQEGSREIQAVCFPSLSSVASQSHHAGRTHSQWETLENKVYITSWTWGNKSLHHITDLENKVYIISQTWKTKLPSHHRLGQESSHHIMDLENDAHITSQTW